MTVTDDRCEKRRFVTVLGATSPADSDDTDVPDDVEQAGLLEIEAGRQREVEPASVQKEQAPGPAASKNEPMLCGIPMKWVSLLALTLQTSGQALLIKWSRSQSQDGAVQYISSTAVFFTEVVKLLASVVLVVMDTGGLRPAVASLSEHFTQAPVELAKAAVPSLIYTVQNNLMFYSFEKLSAPVQQVLYQMKIITTAGLGVLMLGKSLTWTQWASCVMLAFGVALVQWPRDSSVDSLSFGSDQIKGFVAVLSACCTSGFAGVWIQRMLQQTSASIWVRNVQLALFGSVMSIMVAMFGDAERIANEGLMQGYDGRVVAVILMTAFGGLLCAVMLKYAGATHGCFSTAMSIILTSVLSQSLLGDFETDLLFCVGTLFAVAASLVFSLGLPPCVVTFTQRLLR